MEVRPRKISIVEFDGWIWRRSEKGASFCHVERIKPVVRSSPWRTSGSQAWTGANPIFRARARMIIVIGMGWDIC